MHLFNESITVLLVLLKLTDRPLEFALKFIPFVLFLEIPLYAAIWLGVVKYLLGRHYRPLGDPAYSPMVSCTVTCYAEGESVKKTILTLLEQIYPGKIELNMVLDGARQNLPTLRAIREMETVVNRYANRAMKIIAKKQRGGRVSSVNSGLRYARGDIVLAIDGDTSLDNQAIAKIVRHFANENVVACTGVLNVRNSQSSLAARLQTIEYKLTIHASKLGLAEWQAVNNIPGAFGVFRKSFLDRICGWNTGTAEDLDLTLRIKQYLSRHPKLRIEVDPEAFAYTDVPENWRDFFKQRFRWDGDLSYIYLRKHPLAFNPGLIGLTNFIFTLWYGILFQIVMPFLIFLFTIFIFITQNLPVALGTLMLVYLFYCIVIIVQYLLFIALLSPDVKRDLALAWLLPVFPAFSFVIRLWSVFANLNEMLNKGHYDSAMAPWWVLKKDKF